MIAILKFKLPEEEVEHRQALNGGKWEVVAWAVDRQLRDWLKYGMPFKKPEDALQGARDILTNEMQENNLEFSP